MQIVVDNLLTSYSSQGSGPAVLLLHGWGDNSKTFQSLQTELSGKYKAIVLDLPGFGQTQMPPGVWSLDDYAQFIRKFLEKLEVSEPYAIIGHSNGGALAIRGLSIGSLRADRLILLAASGIRSGQSMKRLTLKVIAKVGKCMIFWLPASVKQKLRKRLYGVVGSDLLVAPHLQETFKITVRQDIQEDAKKLAQPTLLVYAENDAAIPLADGQKLSELIPNSKLIQVPDADHFLHQTASAKVNKAVMEFLEK